MSVRLPLKSVMAMLPVVTLKVAMSACVTVATLEMDCHAQVSLAEESAA